MRTRSRSVAPFLLCLALLPPALATAQDFEANAHPVLDIRPSTGAIVVDGELDDPGWRGAVRAGNFAETSPGDNVAPPVQTEVLVTYDATHFYMGFIAEDDPARITAGLRDRDEIWADDYVGIILDTYGDQAWAYELFINPLGVQGDLRMSTGSGEDMGFDLVWQSMGKITEAGFQVEVAIPFASLRFPDAPDGEQVWRATFWRDRKADFRERSSWAAIDRDDPCWLCQFGTLRGIRDVEPGGGLSLLPSVVASQSSGREDPDSPWTAGDFRADFGLGIAYSWGPNLAVEATVNPDFSQVESDAAQIDVNTPFALFFPERRPFFQRGSNLFESWVNAIYTRSINDPYVAAKTTARRGPWDLLHLIAEDEHSPFIIPLEESSRLRLGGESLSNILRVRRSFDSGAFIGGLLTDRRHGTEFDKHGLRVPGGGGHGTVGGLDWRLRFAGNWSWKFQALASHTEEMSDSALSEGLENLTFDGSRYDAAFNGESYWGHALYSGFERDGRTWGLDVDLRVTSPSFRAENGFIASNNRKEVNAWTGWNFRPATELVESVFPMFVAGGAWNFEGKQKDEWLIAEVNFQLIKRTYLEIHQMWSQENYRGVQFDGIRRSQVEFNTSPTGWLQFGAEFQTAHTIRRSSEPFLGKQRAIEAWFSLKLQRLVIDPSIDFVRMTHPDTDEVVFDGFVQRTRVKWQLSRRLFLRTVLQYDDFDRRFDVEPLLSYKVNPFTVFYLGSTHALYDYSSFEDAQDDWGWTQRERQFFLKLQYLFQA